MNDLLSDIHVNFFPMLEWHKVFGLSLPQYYNCGRPMNWGYVSYDEENPSGGEVVHQGMASLYRESHQAGMKMFLLGKHSKAMECHIF